MIKKSRKLRFNATVRPNEYIVWKNRKGKIQKRIDSRNYLIGEIRKKTKRGTFIVGYTNFKKKGTKNVPSPQRYTATQRAFRSTPVRKTRRSDDRLSKRQFIVRSDNFIYKQVPNWAVDIINDEVEKSDFAVWGVRIEVARYGVSTSPMSYTDEILDYNTGRHMIAEKIKSNLDEAELRMSRKNQTENKKHRHIRKLICQIVFSGAFDAF